MRTRLQRVMATAITLVACGVVASEAAAQRPSASLEARMREFMATVHRRPVDSAAVFFPRTGTFDYVLTSHYEDRSVRGIWRFPAADALAAIRGPLRSSFTINYEGQRIGTLSHQVMERGREWRRVPGNRFVPPGATAASAAFVEWRKEGSEWVVASFGDEGFPGAPIPSWVH